MFQRTICSGLPRLLISIPENKISDLFLGPQMNNTTKLRLQRTVSCQLGEGRGEERAIVLGRLGQED